LQDVFGSRRLAHPIRRCSLGFASYRISWPARIASRTFGESIFKTWADRMLAAGDDPSTIRNALMPLRAIYRRATARGDVGLNPTLGIELPAVRGRRERIAPPDESAKHRGLTAS
jgi:hypothetical protein